MLNLWVIESRGGRLLSFSRGRKREKEFVCAGVMIAEECSYAHLTNTLAGLGSAQTLTVCPRLPPSMTMASAILSQGFCAVGSFAAVPLAFAFLISNSTY